MTASARALIASRVGRPILLALLAAVAIVDAAILAPAYHRYYDQGVARSEAAAQAALWMAVDISRGSPRDPVDPSLLRRAASRAALHTPLLGGDIRFPDGRTISFVVPALAGGENPPETRLWTQAEFGFPFDIDAVIDVSGLPEEALARTLSLGALTLLFSLLVIAAGSAAIYILILHRVFGVQTRLRAAAAEPANPERHIVDVDGHDEIDDLADAANTLLGRSAEQLQALNAFNADLESRVAQRTAALQGLTDRLRAEIDERAAAEKRAVDLTAFVQKNPEPALRIAPNDAILYANPTAARILETLGVKKDGTAPTAWRDALFAARVRDDGPDMRAEAQSRHFILRFAQAEDSATVNVYGRDVTIETRAEARAVRAATHDALTELPNRSMFLTEAQALLAHAPDGARLAVVTIGLKSFAAKNQEFGFEGGDAILREVALRLRAAARREDAVGRIAGDEFAMATLGAPDVESAAAAFARLAAVLDVPIPVGAAETIVAAAIGVGYADQADAAATQKALQHARQAMMRAKGGAGATYAFFDPSLEAEAAETRGVAERLRRALADGGFTLHYQPKIAVADGALTGAEALIRLADDDGRPIGPDRFIPIAEQTGLIVDIGRWALREATATFAAAHRDFGLTAPIAVNLSPRQFSDDDVPAMVAEALSESGLPPEMLELEITETAVMRDMASAIDALRALADRRVGIAIDDFGTGHSSLAHLRRLPADKIKLDRSFVTDIESDLNASAIARAVVGLARGLGKRTVAEGVETIGQFQRLSGMGIDEAQGYLFARPTPRDDFLARARAPAPYLGVAVAA